VATKSTGRRLPSGTTPRTKTLEGELKAVSARLNSETSARRSAQRSLRQTQETVTALLNAPPDSALLISTDGTILAANGTAAKRLRRYAPENRGDLVGLCVYDLFPGELSDRRRKRNEAVIRSGKPARYEDERDGRWFDNSIYPVEGRRGKIVGLAVFSRDITERKQAEHALHQSQETIRALLNAPTDSALLVDADGTILAANDTAARRLASHAGIAYEGDPDLLTGMSVYELLPEDLATPRKARNEQVVTSGEPARYEDERNGAWFDNSIYPILNVDGQTRALAIFSRDITDLKRAEERFRHLAFHDSLTGLPNRAALQARLDVALAEARRGSDLVAVMCLDVNGFKRLNDTMGHEAGDQLLEIVAERLRKVIRGNDTAARMGGDEFVLVFPHAHEGTAQKLAERVLRALHVPYQIGGKAVEMTTSIGVSVFPDDGPDSRTLLRLADSAMYRAKAAGGGYAMAEDCRASHVSMTPGRRQQTRLAIVRTRTPAPA